MTPQFTNPNLLETALTHRSYLNENKAVKEHNERLEYLGDAVIELAVSEFLYHEYPNRPEGELTAIRSALVRTETLASVAEALGYGEKLKMSRGEIASGGRQNVALLANTFEAVIGALYLDQGFTVVVSFLQTHLYPKVKDIITKNLYKDFKSTLQENVQAKGQATPEYEVIDEVGPDHDKTFTVVVKVENQALAEGKGKSKQAAQQQAAANALEKMSATWYNDPKDFVTNYKSNMLKIKLSRKGKRNEPHYRVIVAEARSKRDGKVVDSLGFYSTTDKNKKVSIDITKYQNWIEKGAQPTSTVKNLVERVKKSWMTY